MGEELYDDLFGETLKCRIYAPVGEHSDLLAYLVRRLLENGANTSFVNNIQNRELPLSVLLEDPVRQSAGAEFHIPLPMDIYQPHRANSKGLDLEDMSQLIALAEQVKGASFSGEEAGEPVLSPARQSEIVGSICFDDASSMLEKLARVSTGKKRWQARPVEERAEVLLRIADHLQRERHWYIACCLKEAGKTLDDCIGEVREAIDFCRYYAAEAASNDEMALGTVLCISPWNFPLAIFAGQVVAALVTGSTVIAKPAEQTSLVATKLVSAMHDCGIPQDALQLVISPGLPVSEILVPDERIDGVMFTGSTQTARAIARTLNQRQGARLIAETGGLNAMIVDSTALAEQVVDDVVQSAFHSAGQRCSALRVLYVQEDVADEMIEKIAGKMQELVVGDPASYTTDIGPVIDDNALKRLVTHSSLLDSGGARLICRTDVDVSDGHFFAPVFYEIEDLSLLKEEVFGPVLHLKRFASSDLQSVVDEINSTGFGLTFGIHTRIEQATFMSIAIWLVQLLVFSPLVVAAVPVPGPRQVDLTTWVLCWPVKDLIG
jgi:RHH-type proline utilization regulon transcriptional repressor/proline dehydrogenase/delta 1-pyrroline-5-carboxylate dehydrogenase